jgi:methylase of polypeptide subunit release factors
MDHVFCGRCSMRLVARVAEVGAKRRFERGLDLCTGSGVQGLSMSGSCDEVVLGDVNPRALAYARANARVNGVTNAKTVLSDLFSEIDGQFDIITANTPFLLLQEGSKALSGYGGHLGMEVELRLYEQLDQRLMPGGISLVVASSAIVRGENVLATRLREIFQGKGYEIDLVPINTYYEHVHHELYRSLSVDKCILYVVVARKTGTELRLNVHPWTPIKNIAYELEVARKRLKGWASSRRSQGGSARP